MLYRSFIQLWALLFLSAVPALALRAQAPITVSGTITLNGAPLAGISVAAEGAVCTPSAADGGYRCSVPPYWSGTLTPVSADGYRFAPGFYTYSAVSADLAGQNFAATSVFAGSDFGHPYVQNPRPDGITVLWWTTGSVPGLLEYGLDSYDSALQSIPEMVSLTNPAGGAATVRYKHELTLSGLTAGTRYRYRVSRNGGVFESYFKTAPAVTLTPIRFLVWADPETELASYGLNGDGAPAGYPMDQNEGIMASVLASSRLDPDFILIAGDVTEQGGRFKDWNELFRKINDKNPTYYSITRPLASRVPFLAVPGNHDYYGGRWDQPYSEIHALHKFLHHFANPSNLALSSTPDPNWPSERNPAVRAAQQERYFALSYGPVTVIGLDVNNQSPHGTSSDTNWYLRGENDTSGGHAPDWLPGSRQYRWLEEQLQKAQQNSLFTFVFWHHAPYSSGPHGRATSTDKQSGKPTRQLDKLLHQYRVSAVFNGHDEMVEMSETRGDPALGGDPNHIIRYFVVGSPGDGLRDRYPGVINPKQVFHYSDSPLGRHYGFLEVNVAPDGAGLWKATFRQLWINPAWADDRSLDPVGGYYDEASPAAYFEAGAAP